MVIKKIKFLVIIILIICNKFTYASQILDFETENFITKLINDIKNVNKINRNIYFRILSDKEINAFVDEQNIINITSGLIENSPDYVALFSVLAHEVGHIDNNHIMIRKDKNKNINNLRDVSNLSIIAGSMISNSPELLQGFALSSAGISNISIKFSKDQETEADFYSLETLKKLNISSDSIIELLKIIEKKALEKGLTKEMQRISSHPYFEERINIVNFLNNKSNEYNHALNDEFKFIQAKFLGYNSNYNQINKLENPYKLYSNSILEAKNGNIYQSLKILNDLIAEYSNNIYFIETKADILFSYGYTRESIAFYEIVLSKVPDNIYAQIRVFTNKNIEKLSTEELDLFFIKNLNLIERFYNNKNIILTFLKLSEVMSKLEWVEFLNYWSNNYNEDKKIIQKDIKNYKKTKNKTLLKLVNIINKDLK